MEPLTSVADGVALVIATVMVVAVIATLFLLVFGLPSVAAVLLVAGPAWLIVRLMGQAAGRSGGTSYPDRRRRTGALYSPRSDSGRSR